jgi:hypothetical protein
MKGALLELYQQKTSATLRLIEHCQGPEHRPFTTHHSTR